MFSRFINKLWPLKEFLNYIFKKTLGDYIMNDLDLNKIEIEIKNNTFISLSNIELNAHEINKKHFKNSPIKMLEGRISQLHLIVSKEKIEIKLDDVFILFMPIFNEEKFNSNQVLKNQGISINSDNNVENSLISNLVNSALSSLEVSVRNVCVKILTYEAFNNSRDNPTISLFIGKIDYKRHKSVQDENNDAKDEDKKIENKNDINNNNKDKDLHYEKLFIFNKQILFDKICIKLDRNIKIDESTFFNICNLNDEKLLFNFFCDNSCILAMNYSNNYNNENTFTCNSNNNDTSFYINLLETNISSNNCDGLKIEIFFKKIEIFLTPFQLQMLKNFTEICGIIFNKKMKNEKDQQNTKTNININIPNEESASKSIKIFNYKISTINVNFYLEMFNFILNENSYSYETPKLWSFYENNYSKSLKKIENLESHFAYTEDNFFIFNLNKIQFKYANDKLNSLKSLNLDLESINTKYVEYKNKIKNNSENKNKEKKLKFSNSKISSSKLNLTLMNSMSRDHSIYQTVYQSVMSNDNSNLNLTHNNSGSMFESAMESDILLVEKFNKLFDYDYFYYSHSIFTLKPQFMSETTSLVVKMLNEESSEEKSYVSFMFGDICFDFHPVFMFKAMKVVYSNSILINEILYFFSSSSSNLFIKEEIEYVNKDYFKENDKKDEKKEIIEVNSNSNYFLNKKAKRQILISINEIKLTIFNFSSNQSSSLTLSPYFTDFYKNNIEEVNLSLQQGQFKERIINTSSNISHNEMLISNLQSKDSITLKLIRTNLLINTKIKQKRKHNNILINFDQIFAYMNSYLLLNYKKQIISVNDNLNSTSQISMFTHVINKKNKFVTGNYSNKNLTKENSNKHIPNNFNNSSNKNNINTVNEDIDTIFNKNKMNFRMNDISIDNYSEYIDKDNFNYHKKIKDVISNSYLIHNYHKEDDIDNFSEEKFEFKQFKRNIFKINIKENFNITTDLKNLISLQNFIDTLLFTFNMNKIFLKTMKTNYEELKLKIFDSYNLNIKSDDFSLIFLSNVNEHDINEDHIIKFNLLSVATQNINLMIMKNKTEEIISKINLYKLNLSLITINENNQLLLSLNNIRLLLRKKYDLKIKEDYLNRIDEGLYNYILYKGNSSEQLHAVQVVINFQEEVLFGLENIKNKDKNLCLSPLPLEEYLKRNLISMNDMTVTLKISINDLIISPFSLDFNISIFETIAEDLLEIKKEEFVNNDSNITIEGQLLNLLKNRKVNLKQNILINKIIFDIIFNPTKDTYNQNVNNDKKKWMRLLFLIEKITHEKNKELITCSSSNITFTNIQAHSLQNLQFEGTDKLLINKLEDIGMENSIFKKLGFIEIMNIDKIGIKLSKEEDEGDKIDIGLGSLELNFCKDSFTSLINLIKLKIERTSEIMSLFKFEITENKEKLNEDNFKLNSVEKNLPLLSSSHKNSPSDEANMCIYDDYCEGGDYMKDVIIMSDEHIDQISRQSINRRKRSSFDFIQGVDEEYKVPLNSGAISINLSLTSFRLYLFKGKDFDFKDENHNIWKINSKNSNMNSNKINYSIIETGNMNKDKNKDKDKDKEKNKDKDKEKDSKFELIEDYCDSFSRSMINNSNHINYPNSNHTNHSINNDMIENKQRERNKLRDYDNHIGLNLQNLKFESVFYTQQSQSDKNFFLKFSIEKFEIDDYVKKSKYKKLISKFEYDDPAPFIEFKAEMLRSEQSDKESQGSSQNVKLVNNIEVDDSELYIELNVIPINFLLDQSTLIFLLDFFSVKLNNSNNMNTSNASNMSFSNNTFTENELQNIDHMPIPVEKIEKNENTNSSVKLIFVRRVKINEFFINFSYNSHSVSITKIKNKNYLELLNLSNITNFRIILKNIDFQGCKTIPDTLEMIFIFWKNDITKNQILSAVLQSVAVIRPFTTILEGFLDIFKQPWIYYKTEKSLKDGFTKGLKSFVLSFTSQSLFLGEKIFITMKNYLGAHDNFQDRTLNKKSYYKKFLYYIDNKKRKYDEYYLKK